MHSSSGSGHWVTAACGQELDISTDNNLWRTTESTLNTREYSRGADSAEGVLTAMHDRLSLGAGRLIDRRTIETATRINYTCLGVAASSTRPCFWSFNVSMLSSELTFIRRKAYVLAFATRQALRPFERGSWS